MTRIQRAVLFFCLLTPFFTGTSHADSLAVRPWDGLGQNSLHAFTGTNALPQVAGVAATYALIETDADYRVQRFFQEHEVASRWFIPVTMTGALGPLALGLPFYFVGRHRKDPELMGAGSCVLQATAVSFSYISLLKAITGRSHPDTAEYADMRAAARDFKFGFGKRGIFWGWPSGHAGVTMAVASSLAAYYPDKPWVRYSAAGLVLYTTIGVAAVGGGHMHWFSDAIAADLMCYAIGTTIGTYFRARVKGAPPRGTEGVPAAASKLSTYCLYFLKGQNHASCNCETLARPERRAKKRTHQPDCRGGHGCGPGPGACRLGRSGRGAARTLGRGGASAGHYR
jgi:membrane-associated PAP2 superfamily phosphatase